MIEKPTNWEAHSSHPSKYHHTQREDLTMRRPCQLKMPVRPSRWMLHGEERELAADQNGTKPWCPKTKIAVNADLSPKIICCFSKIKLVLNGFDPPSNVSDVHKCCISFRLTLSINRSGGMVMRLSTQMNAPSDAYVFHGASIGRAG